MWYHTTLYNHIRHNKCSNDDHSDVVYCEDAICNNNSNDYTTTIGEEQATYIRKSQSESIGITPKSNVTNHAQQPPLLMQTNFNIQGENVNEVRDDNEMQEIAPSTATALKTTESAREEELVVGNETIEDSLKNHEEETNTHKKEDENDDGIAPSLASANNSITKFIAQQSNTPQEKTNDESSHHPHGSCSLCNDNNSNKADNNDNAKDCLAMSNQSSRIHNNKKNKLLAESLRKKDGSLITGSSYVKNSDQKRKLTSYSNDGNNDNSNGPHNYNHADLHHQKVVNKMYKHKMPIKLLQKLAMKNSARNAKKSFMAKNEETDIINNSSDSNNINNSLLLDTIKDDNVNNHENQKSIPSVSIGHEGQRSIQENPSLPGNGDAIKDVKIEENPSLWSGNDNVTKDTKMEENSSLLSGNDNVIKDTKIEENPSLVSGNDNVIKDTQIKENQSLMLGDNLSHVYEIDVDTLVFSDNIVYSSLSTENNDNTDAEKMVKYVYLNRVEETVVDDKDGTALLPPKEIEEGNGVITNETSPLHNTNKKVVCFEDLQKLSTEIIEHELNSSNCPNEKGESTSDVDNSDVQHSSSLKSIESRLSKALDESQIRCIQDSLKRIKREEKRRKDIEKSLHTAENINYNKDNVETLLQILEKQALLRALTAPPPPPTATPPSMLPVQPMISSRSSTTYVLGEGGRKRYNLRTWSKMMRSRSENDKQKLAEETDLDMYDGIDILDGIPVDNDTKHLYMYMKKQMNRDVVDLLKRDTMQEFLQIDPEERQPVQPGSERAKQKELDPGHRFLQEDFNNAMEIIHAESMPVLEYLINSDIVQEFIDIEPVKNGEKTLVERLLEYTGQNNKCGDNLTKLQTQKKGERKMLEGTNRNHNCGEVEKADNSKKDSFLDFINFFA